MKVRPKIRLLSSSRLKASRRCARYHAIKYEMGYESTRKSDPLVQGGLLHSAMEAWWESWQRGGRGRTPLQAALEALDVAVLANEVDRFTVARMQAMVEGYHARWAPEMEAGDWEVLGIELEFVAPLVHPTTGERARGWIMGGKLDVLARHRPTDRVLLIEHKSSSEDLAVGGKYWKRLRMDGQVSVYFDGAASLGHKVDACVYDVLRKLDHKPHRATPLEERTYTKEKRNKEGVITEPSRLYKTQREEDETAEAYLDRCRAAIAEKPEAFFLREDVVRLEREMVEHRLEAWEQARLIDEREAAGFASRNTDACFDFHRECEFFDPCSGSGSLDDQTLYRLRTTVHPELSFPEPPTKAAPPAEEIPV